MEESFGDGKGLYWGIPGEAPCRTSGLQAEYAELKNAVVTDNDSREAHGTGYVILKPEGSITWYQENDGAAMPMTMKIRYSSPFQGTSELDLLVNGKMLGTLKFNGSGSTAKDWKCLETVINIQSGANTIRLASRKGPAPDIDEIVLESAEKLPQDAE